MRMPGFTAETSFANTNRGYQTARSSRTPRTSGEFLPQFMYWSYCNNSGCYTCTPWGCQKLPGGPHTKM
jgi:hypothetical protein